MIDHEGNRPVIDQGDLHVRLENPLLNMQSKPCDLVAEEFVKLSRLVRRCRRIKTRSAAFAAISCKGELRDDQNIPSAIEDRAEIGRAHV